VRIHGAIEKAEEAAAEEEEEEEGDG